MPGGVRKKYEHYDYFVCLMKVREDYPRIKFLCKGAKLNVMPSRMCSQMSMGLVAYELTMGKTATFDQIVQIFDYEDVDIVTDPKEQFEFYQRWLKSLGEGGVTSYET
ncbi:hypothetical protein SAMN04487857_1413 [Pseudomonas sp. ok272]|nr:hypothetical protein SAMN04487857_1413 [Pseudomonas sp. ok272]SFN47689.1 hypothetical protein SAMN04487858_1413 [Pseudomonas sp. ok602]